METDSDLHRHLGFWLRRVSNQVSGGFARALAERGVSVAEWVALSQVAAGQDVNPAAIAAATGMTRGAISKVVDKLRDKKWLTRTVSDDDNRVQFLSLTRKGRQVLPELARIADGNDEHFFAALAVAEQDTLRRLLQKVAAAHGITHLPID